MHELGQAELKHLLDHKMERRSRLAFARLGAEAASYAGSFGTILLMKKIAPHQLDEWNRIVGEKLVRPHLEGFENMLDRLPGLEPDAKSARRDSMSEDEKVAYISKLLVTFGILSASGVAIQAGAQGAADHLLGLPPVKGNLMVQASKMLGVVMIDKLIHAGTFLTLNTALKEHNQEAQDVLSTSLTNRMVPKETADMFASYFNNWIFPSAVGMLGSVGVLDRVYSKEIAQRLEELGKGSGKAH